MALIHFVQVFPRPQMVKNILHRPMTESFSRRHLYSSPDDATPKQGRGNIKNGSSRPLSPGDKNFTRRRKAVQQLFVLLVHNLEWLHLSPYSLLIKNASWSFIPLAPTMLKYIQNEYKTIKWYTLNTNMHNTQTKRIYTQSWVIQLILTTKSR